MTLMPDISASFGTLRVCLRQNQSLLGQNEEVQPTRSRLTEPQICTTFL